MTVLEHIRRHLEDRAGLHEKAPPMPSLESLRKSEQCPEFRQLRDNRLIMGAFRYGLLGVAGKPKYDRIECSIRRLREYQLTGNTEHLLDVANMMELEWVEGDHPLKHFQPKDDGEHTKPKG